MNFTSIYYRIYETNSHQILDEEIEDTFTNNTYNITQKPIIIYDHEFNNNSDTYQNFEAFAHLISTYYTPFLAISGSIGNILSVLVFFKTKLRKLSSSYYLSALGISDTCFLITLIMPWLTVLDINIYTEDLVCKLTQFVSALCSFLSVWFVVAFTVERFIAVLYPLKRQTMCTVRRAKLVLCILTLLGMVHSSPTIIFSSSMYMDSMNRTLCSLNEEYRVSNIYFQFNLIKLHFKCK